MRLRLRIPLSIKMPIRNNRKTQGSLKIIDFFLSGELEVRPAGVSWLGVGSDTDENWFHRNSAFNLCFKYLLLVAEFSNLLQCYFLFHNYQNDQKPNSYLK